MAIYTKLETGERIRSTKNEDGSTSKKVIGQTKQPVKIRQLPKSKSMG